MTTRDGTADLDRIPDRHPLANKPLVEAIFELRWALTSDERDPGFRIFLGRFYDQVKANYPLVRDLSSSQAPEELTPHVVRHQFWKGEQTWPVTQVGPGIMTFNETSGYLWDTFRPKLVEVITAVYDSYPSEIAQLNPVQATLRYVDSVEFDRSKADPPLLVFLRDGLHTSVDVEPLLFESETQRLNPLRFRLVLGYELNRPKGLVTLSVANGSITKEPGKQAPSLIWETSVVSTEKQLPNDTNGWATWLEEAHDVSDRWFFALTRGKLLASFEGEHANGNTELRG